MQTIGAFDNTEQENMDFKKLSDSELKSYFLEWYFTADYANDNKDNEQELYKARKQLLKGLE